MKIYLLSMILSALLVGCDGCDSQVKNDTSVSDKQPNIKSSNPLVQEEQRKRVSGEKNDTPNGAVEAIEGKQGLSKEKSESDKNVQKVTLSNDSNESVFYEEGSPANPYSDTKEDTDPGSPKNAKMIVEDPEMLPQGHPAKAGKISSNDPDLLEKGSPANPIEDFTGEDILEKK